MFDAIWFILSLISTSFGSLVGEKALGAVLYRDLFAEFDIFNNLKI
jgi:hypothetical protein